MAKDGLVWISDGNQHSQTENIFLLNSSVLFFFSYGKLVPSVFGFEHVPGGRQERASDSHLQSATEGFIDMCARFRFAFPFTHVSH